LGQTITWNNAPKHQSNFLLKGNSVNTITAC
jgi:hypothetical protein